MIIQRCDLSNPLEVDKIIEDVNFWYENQLCLIINNAGKRSLYSELEKVMQINCYTPFKIMQEFRLNNLQMFNATLLVLPAY